MSEVCHLRVEHYSNKHTGIGHSQPRVSWTIETAVQDWVQSSYELKVTWDDGVEETHTAPSCASSCLVPWPFRPLRSRERCSIRVKVSSDRGENSGWSSPLEVEAGLLQKSDWTGVQVIEPNTSTSTGRNRRPVLFRRLFQSTDTVSTARLYITAHGVYEAKINGKPVGDRVLAPGWTSYKHRLACQSYDVSTLLQKGAENCIEVTVAEGWYSGRLGFNGGKRNIYGDELGVIAILQLDLADGSTERIVTDDSWNWTLGPIIESSLYDGEHCDLRAVLHPATSWHKVQTSEVCDNIVISENPPIRRTQDLSVQDVLTSPLGKTILDLGQNMVGWLRIKVSGPVGTKITLRFAEVLEGGECCFRTLRGALATDSLVLASHGEVEWEPSFTYHGFRYVEVTGWPGIISKESAVGVVVHTDMQRTGYFSCSNPDVNQLHSNIVWSMRGNFVSIPTDCPQRDERLGWTGDINMFAETANYLYDTTGILTSWLQDLGAEQNNGIVPLTIPNVVNGLETEAHAIWGDVAVMLPWALYLTTGDKEILRSQYSTMIKWLSAIPRKPNGLWNYTSDWKLGDWLDPAAPPDDPGNATTDPSYVSDTFLAHILALMVRISSLVGTVSDEEKFSIDLANVRKAFIDEYVTAKGRLSADTQTGYALALVFELLTSPTQRATAESRLETLVRRNSLFKIATGFAGTPYLGAAMTSVGLTQLFYKMLLQKQCPGWLYPVSMGATTVWERWDSMLPDGSVNPGEMTSFNHYALGAIAGWMHSTVAGLSPITPGWQEFAVKPIPGGGLSWAEGSYDSCYGFCNVRWEVRRGSGETTNSTLWVRVKVPPNTTAQVQLPGWTESVSRGSGTYEWNVLYDPPPWPPETWYPRFMERPADDL